MHFNGRVKVSANGKLQKPVRALTEESLKRVIQSLKDTGWVIKGETFLRGPYICCVMEFEGRK